MEAQITVSTDLIVIRQSKIHGTGVYARVDIPEETDVIEYVGEKIDKQESLRRCENNNQYIFTRDDEYDIDGSVDWNPARFINHSCSPNCEALIDDDNRVWIVAARDIKAGEELSYNYNFDLDEYRDYPCNCGSPDCVGFMVAEEFFPHVRRARALAAEAAKAQITSAG